MSLWMPGAQRTLVLTSTPGFTGSAKKITLHTMECGSASKGCWPTYGYGRSTPHFSLCPGTGEIRQHIPMNRSARALVSPGGGRSPNINAGVNIQIEVVGWAKDVYRYDDAWYKQLAAWVTWIAKDQGVPLTIPFSWPLTGGYGTSGKGRVSWEKFRDTSGVVAHVNVPLNSHWDAPFDQARLKKLLGIGGLIPTPPPPPTPPPITDGRKKPFEWSKVTADLGAGAYMSYPCGRGNCWNNTTPGGRRGAKWIMEVQKAMNARGYNLKVDGVYGAKTDRMVNYFQTNIWKVKAGGCGKNTWDAIWRIPIK